MNPSNQNQKSPKALQADRYSARRAVLAAAVGNRSRALVGGVLRPAVGIAQEYADGLARLVAELGREIKSEMLRVFAEHEHHGALDYAMDAPDDPPTWGNVSSQSRIALNKLLDKWQPKFDAWARDATGRMIDRTTRNSEATLKISLKELSANITLPSPASNPRLKEIITASGNEAAGFIELIPQKYLQEVGGQVARSITSGRGLADLVPYLTKKYDGNIKWARLVALDQTRKVYSSMNAARMQAIGMTTYRWRHTPGSKEPRKDHIAMEGKIYSVVQPSAEQIKAGAPPMAVINRDTGELGIPGQAIFCRCTMQPIVSFEEKHAA